jgi:L-asparagine oxygenase
MDQYIIELNEDEIAILNDLAAQITVSPSGECEQFCDSTRHLVEQIPERIREQLCKFSQKGSQSGYLLLRKVSVPYVGTPPNNTFMVGETTQLARIQALFVSAIAHMISYEAEGHGRLFQDVVPVQSMAKNQTSIGSNVELEIHTEQAFSKLKPDILCLSCLRGDPDALTYIFPVREILSQMTKHEQETLRNPLWKCGVDLSFKLHGQEFAEGDVRGPMPIIYGSDDDPLLTFDQDLMFSDEEAGKHLLKKVVALYYEKRGQHNLKPGEIILIDNKRAVHGRSPFYPKYNSNDRFLIRCFGVFDYDKSATARVGRTVRAIYS